MEVTQEQFEEIKKSIIEQATAKGACRSELQRAIDAQTWSKLKDFIYDNIWWCIKNNILIPDGYYKNDWREFTLVNGKLHGEFVSYYKNGQVEWKCNYVNGERHGESIVYYGNGQVEWKCNYVNGQYHGEYVKYYSDGQVDEKCTYVKGNLHGERICYFENGKVYLKHNFVKGKLRIVKKTRLNKSFEYALIPIKHASEALVEVCNDKSIIKPYYEPKFDKNEIPEYEWDKRPYNAILITQELFGAYEQEYIEKVYGGSWHVNNELSDEPPYVLDILKSVYGEKEINGILNVS